MFSRAGPAREASPAAFAHGFASDDLSHPAWFRPWVPVQAPAREPVPQQAREPVPQQAREPVPPPARGPVQPPAQGPVQPPARGPVPQQVQPAEAPAHSCSRRRPPRPPANSHTDQPTTTDAFPCSCSPPGLQSCLRLPPRPAKTATPEGPTRAHPNRTCKQSLYHSPTVSTDFSPRTPVAPSAHKRSRTRCPPRPVLAARRARRATSRQPVNPGPPRAGPPFSRDAEAGRS